MSGSNGKKSEGKPTVVYSGKECVLCDRVQRTETVLLNYARNGFRGPVCAEHLFTLLRKWQKSQDAMREDPEPKEVVSGKPQ